jgi:hypothetical protein
VQVLKSKRPAEMVKESHEPYFLADNFSGIVNIPITITTQEKTKSVIDQQRQENWIDPAVILILKEVRVLFIDELQTKIESKLEMKINDNWSETRLIFPSAKVFLPSE